MARQKQEEHTFSRRVSSTPTVRWTSKDDGKIPARSEDLPITTEWLDEHVDLDGFTDHKSAAWAVYVDYIAQACKSNFKWDQQETTREQILADMEAAEMKISAHGPEALKLSELRKRPSFADMTEEAIRDAVAFLKPEAIVINDEA